LKVSRLMSCSRWSVGYLYFVRPVQNFVCYVHHQLVICRTAIVLGTAIPLVLFLVWNGVILGSITNLEMGSSGKILDPLQQLQSSNGVVGVSRTWNILFFEPNFETTYYEVMTTFFFFISFIWSSAHYPSVLASCNCYILYWVHFGSGWLSCSVFLAYCFPTLSLCISQVVFRDWVCY